MGLKLGLSDDAKYEAQFKRNEEFTKMCSQNGVPTEAYQAIMRVNPRDASGIARGIQFVSDYWDCSPNGAVLDKISEYLYEKRL